MLFGVFGRREEAVYQFFVSVRGAIGFEGGDFGGCGEEAGEIESDAANQSAAIGFGRRLEAFLRQTRA